MQDSPRLTPNSGAGGITLESPAPETPNSRSRAWSFTWNDPPDSPDSLISWFQLRGATYIFQEEVGEECGRRHWQGCVKFRNQCYFKQIKAHVGTAHLRNIKASKEDWNRCVAYCQKERTSTGLIWHSEDIKLQPVKETIPRKEIEDMIAIHGPLRWQKEVIDIVTKVADDRHIIWVADPQGHSGKSKLVIHLRRRFKTIQVDGKRSDIAYLMAEEMEKYDEGDQPDIVMIDLTKSQANHVSYSAIEKLKDGQIISTKYKCREVQLRYYVHVIVFSNDLPLAGQWTEDRVILIIPH